MPNAITISRMVLAIAAFAAAMRGVWVFAFWLIVIALLTDFFDGLAAIKLDAKSVFGEKLDPLADSSIVLFGLLSLGFTGNISWFLVLIVLGGGLLIGRSPDKLFHIKVDLSWRTAISVVCIFLAWIGIVWFYAALAFGWSWTYVSLTILVLSILALLKRHRIKAWIGR